MKILQQTKTISNRIYNDIICELKILIKSPKTFFFRWFKCIIPRNIFWIKKDIETKQLWYTICLPNNHFVYCVLMETFMRELFSEMKWLEKVLDIWWFIWESAIYLSIYNREVYVYELSPTNYKYLVKNCWWIKNIHYFNWCISNSSDEYVNFSDTGNVSSINKKEQDNGNNVRIKNYNIVELLKSDNFDWLKIDIEWWEYNILKPIINNGLFKFKKWFIEFHDLDKKENMEYLEQFDNLLKKMWYNTEFFNNEKKVIKINEKIKYCNVYFGK